jgi:hypothetical protein
VFFFKRCESLGEKKKKIGKKIEKSQKTESEKKKKKVLVYKK